MVRTIEGRKHTATEGLSGSTLRPEHANRKSRLSGVQVTLSESQLTELSCVCVIFFSVPKHKRALHLLPLDWFADEVGVHATKYVRGFSVSIGSYPAVSVVSMLYTP